MENQDVHQALNSLYEIARMALVNADNGEVRDNCFKVLSEALSNVETKEGK